MNIIKTKEIKYRTFNTAFAQMSDNAKAIFFALVNDKFNIGEAQVRNIKNGTSGSSPEMEDAFPYFFKKSLLEIGLHIKGKVKFFDDAQ